MQQGGRPTRREYGSSTRREAGRRDGAIRIRMRRIRILPRCPGSAPIRTLQARVGSTRSRRWTRCNSTPSPPPSSSSSIPAAVAAAPLAAACPAAAAPLAQQHRTSGSSATVRLSGAQRRWREACGLARWGATARSAHAEEGCQVRLVGLDLHAVTPCPQMSCAAP